MKRLLRTIAASMLAVLARAVVRKYKPAIVMVTGSVGKTSTKDAVAAALAGQTFVRASEKSFNSEFGVPLTILGSKNPWTHPFAWFSLFAEAIALILLPNHYPKLLVLEVGADRPGDLAKILRIATPDAVVVTMLPAVPVHVEAYASPEAVRDEEFAPAYALAPDAPLVFNSEDEYARRYAARVPARGISFGFSPDAHASVGEARIRMEDGRAAGMEADIAVGGHTYSLFAPGVLGRQQLLAPAAAVALAEGLGRSVSEALKGLANYTPPPGRGRLLHGLKHSTIIDDSYNASPAAVEEALSGLKALEAKRRIAVLGDMLELGRYSVEEHEKAGKRAAACADIIAAVGIRARAIADAAEAAGTPAEHVHRFDSAAAAASVLPGIVQEGDAILVKGSQSVRTERVVEALLSDSADRALLVRQDKEWKKR
jgi:UDP-N-acetylmuramoyl-tripeptide--D-alanyl-D-alanine ligase